MNRYEVPQKLATEILTAIAWLAGELPGSYVQIDAMGNHNDKEWKDTSPLVVISGESRKLIEKLEPSLEALMETGECDLLGAYFRMKPRGRIELYRGPLSSCFWQMVPKLVDQFPVTAWQLSRLAEAWVQKTLKHEEFHHHIDVLMVLFGTHAFKDRLLEEALAVACSHNDVSRRGGSVFYWDNLPEPLKAHFLDSAYRYSAPGYRDWKKYEGWEWKNATIGYVIHPNAQRLIEMASGEPFQGSHMMRHMFDYDSSNMVDIEIV